MRGKDLLECIEHIDDALIEEALEPASVPHRNSLIAKWGLVAASVVVIGISATAFWSHQNIRDEHIESAGGEDTASPMAMDATADNIDNAGNSSDRGLTAGTAAANTQAGVEERAANRYSEAGGDDAVSQDTAADAASSKENVIVQDMGKALAEEETAKLAYTVISDYYGEKDNSVYDYPAPEKGKFFCYHYLQKTMEYYTAQENATDAAASSIYAYEVVIDVYGDVEIEGCRGIHYEQLNMLDDTDAGNMMIEQEYMRLVELGYAVRLSEDFQLTGIFTKVELDTFQASPEYGYVFRFANEF